jgi:NADP-dependent 3-hydroxy acid dehydrogenase YdfG
VTRPPLLVIAGAGPGIGLATALRFGAEGFVVGLVARRRETLDTCSTALAAAGVRSIARTADCGIPGELAPAIDALLAEAGPADVLLYNAAHLKWKPLLEEDADSLTRDFAVNAAGALTATRALLPGMLAAARGTLLYTGSTFATEPQPAFGSLSVGKAALRNLVHGVARSVESSPLRLHYLDIRGRVTADDPVRSPGAIAGRCWQLHTAPDPKVPVDVAI